MLAAVSCQDPPPATPRQDAGADEPDAAVPPAPEPTEPDAPRFEDWPCRPGWLAERVAPDQPWGPTICAPPKREECDDDALQLPGDAACRPLGPACPETTDGFPTQEEIRRRAPGFGGSIRHVLPGARPGGTGSREAPFRTMQEALGRAAPSGTVLALAAGRHPGGARLTRAVAVVGACAGETHIHVEAAGAPALGLELTGDGGQLVTALTVAATGPDTLGLLVRNHAAPVVLRHVAVLDTGLPGISVEVGEAAVEEVVIRRSALQGLQVVKGATVEARGLVVEDAWGSGVWVSTSPGDPLSTLRLEDAAIRRSGHHGFDLGTPSDTTVVGSLVERSGATGLLASPVGPPVRLALEDLVVEGPGGRGLEVHGGADVSVRRGLFSGCRGVAVFSPSYHAGQPATLALSDLVVRDTEPADSGLLGLGVGFVGGGELTLARTLLLRNHSTALAVLADDPGAALEATLEDVAVLDTDSRGDGLLGWGIGLMMGVQATGRRLWIEGSRDVGLGAIGWGAAPETRARLEHVRVLATRPAACGDVPEERPGSCVIEGRSYAGGSGVVVSEGARLTLERFVVAGSAQAGLLLAPEGLLRASDGQVHGNAIGLNLMQADVDLDHLTDVRVSDNGTAVARQELPVPDASAVLEGL